MTAIVAEINKLKTPGFALRQKVDTDIIPNRSGIKCLYINITYLPTAIASSASNILVFARDEVEAITIGLEKKFIDDVAGACISLFAELASGEMARFYRKSFYFANSAKGSWLDAAVDESSQLIAVANILEKERK